MLHEGMKCSVLFTVCPCSLLLNQKQSTVDMENVFADQLQTYFLCSRPSLGVNLLFPVISNAKTTNIYIICPQPLNYHKYEAFQRCLQSSSVYSHPTVDADYQTSPSFSSAFSLSVVYHVNVHTKLFLVRECE